MAYPVMIEGIEVTHKNIGDHVYDDYGDEAEVIGLIGHFVRIRYLENKIVARKHPRDLTWM